jgi:hypothetical protein
MNTQSDSNILRTKCLELLSFDLIGIAETHLLGTNKINLKGFTWFGNNRKYIHRNAKHGSGGVGFLVKDNMLLDFNISILNDSQEGILWLK